MWFNNQKFLFYKSISLLKKNSLILSSLLIGGVTLYLLNDKWVHRLPLKQELTHPSPYSLVAFNQRSYSYILFKGSRLTRDIVGPSKRKDALEQVENENKKRIWEISMSDISKIWIEVGTYHLIFNKMTIADNSSYLLLQFFDSFWRWHLQS